MANIECKDCGDLVDVEARTVTLPFVCKWCEEDFHTPNPGESEFESESESLDQLDLDTKLIEDLSNQLAEANNQIKSLENDIDSYKREYSILYKDFESTETLYFLERGKTWWERLWA